MLLNKIIILVILKCCRILDYPVSPVRTASYACFGRGCSVFYEIQKYEII